MWTYLYVVINRKLYTIARLAKTGKLEMMTVYNRTKMLVSIGQGQYWDNKYVRNKTGQHVYIVQGLVTYKGYVYKYKVYS